MKHYKIYQNLFIWVLFCASITLCTIWLFIMNHTSIALILVHIIFIIQIGIATTLEYILTCDKWKDNNQK